MKRTADELDLDSLIDNIELMNCLDGYDELRLLKESSNINIEKFNFNNVNLILNETNKRYKRYLANINWSDHEEIEDQIYVFLRVYKKDTVFSHIFMKNKNLIEQMIKIDKMILQHLDKNETKKKIKTSEKI
jgi:hypothetical protein